MQHLSGKVDWYTGGFFGQLFQIDPEYGVQLPALTAAHLPRVCTVCSHMLLQQRMLQAAHIPCGA